VPQFRVHPSLWIFSLQIVPLSITLLIIQFWSYKAFSIRTNSCQLYQGYWKNLYLFRRYMFRPSLAIFRWNTQLFSGSYLTTTDPLFCYRSYFVYAFISYVYNYNTVVYGPFGTQIPTLKTAWTNLPGKSSKSRISVDYHFWLSQDQHDGIHHSFPGMCRLEILFPSTRYSLRMFPYKAKTKGWPVGGNAWEPLRGSRPGVAHPNILNKNPWNQEMGGLLLLVGCWLTVNLEGPNPGDRQDVDPGFMWVLLVILKTSEFLC
jgi:hypothetical protein